MGKTTKPLKIFALPPVSTWEELATYLAQGHTLAGIEECDVALGPQCHFMDEQHRQYLPLAIQERQRRKYPTPKKKKGKET